MLRLGDPPVVEQSHHPSPVGQPTQRPSHHAEQRAARRDMDEQVQQMVAPHRGAAERVVESEGEVHQRPAADGQPAGGRRRPSADQAAPSAFALQVAILNRLWIPRNVAVRFISKHHVSKPD